MKSHNWRLRLPPQDPRQCVSGRSLVQQNTCTRYTGSELVTSELEGTEAAPSFMDESLGSDASHETLRQIRRGLRFLPITTNCDMRGSLSFHTRSGRIVVSIRTLWNTTRSRNPFALKMPLVRKRSWPRVWRNGVEPDRKAVQINRTTFLEDERTYCLIVFVLMIFKEVWIDIEFLHQIERADTDTWSIPISALVVK